MVIKKIDESNREEFYKLAKEYLPDCDYLKVQNREKKFSKSYLLAIENQEVVGVAFGWDRSIDDPSDSSFCINGLAIKEEYQRRGYGSRMVEEICKVALFYQCNSVTVGSAGGYVEQFYVSLGFVPICYKVFNDAGIHIEKVFDTIDSYYSYKRKSADGFIVMKKQI